MIKLLAKNLRLLEQNKPMQPFLYKDKGSMATVGKSMTLKEINGLLSCIVTMIIWCTHPPALPMVCQGVIVHIRVLIGIKGEDWKASRLLLQTQCIAEINLLKECGKSDEKKKGFLQFLAEINLWKFSNQVFRKILKSDRYKFYQRLVDPLPPAIPGQRARPPSHWFLLQCRFESKYFFSIFYFL